MTDTEMPPRQACQSQKYRGESARNIVAREIRVHGVLQVLAHCKQGRVA